MKRPRYRLYVRLFILTALPLILSAALFNVLVDPFDAYPSLHIQRLEPYKDQGETRIAKAEAYLRGEWDVVILGNSVAEGGFDPRSPVWGDRRVFNFALRGIPVPEMSDQADFILDHHPPREVVIGLTFNLFTDPRPNRFEYIESRLNPQMTGVEYHLRNALGLFASQCSWDVLAAARAGRPGEPHVRGFSVAADHSPYQSRDVRFIFEGNFRAGAAPHFRQGVHTFGQRLILLHNLVMRFRRAGVNVTLVMLPTHWTDLLATRELGWWPAYEETVLNLAHIADQQINIPLGTVRFVSFAAVNEFTTEPIPPSGDAPPLRWFHDPGHFKPELGERMVTELFADTPPPPPMGRVLHVADVPAYLEELRAGIDRQSSVAPRDAELVRHAVAAE